MITHSPEELRFISDFLNSQDFAAKELPGDVSHRTFIRIKTSSKSYILMISKDTSIVPYVEIAQFLRSCDIKVPQIHASSKSLELVMMEDGGDTLLQSLISSSEDQLFTYYKQVLNELYKLQSLDFLHTPLYNHFLENQFSSDLFYKELLMTEEYLFHENLHLQFNTDDYRSECRKMSDALVKLPFTLTHRDYHSRNILIKNEAPFIVDFQDARLGPIFYDVTSLLEDSYMNLSKPLRTKLLNYYLEISKTSYSLGDYSLTQLQRSLKAAGTFAFAQRKKNTDLYLQYLPSVLHFAAEAVQPLSSEYPTIAKLLEDVSQ